MEQVNYHDIDNDSVFLSHNQESTSQVPNNISTPILPAYIAYTSFVLFR